MDEQGIVRLQPKKRGSRILTTHALSCVDPDVHVLQVDLTFTDAQTSSKLVHTFLIAQIFNDSKTIIHNNTIMTQHTSPILYFHTDATRKKKELVYLIHNTYTSPKVQVSLPANSLEQFESSFGFFLFVSLSNSPATEAQLSVRRSGRLLTRLSSLLPNFSY